MHSHWWRPASRLQPGAPCLGWGGPQIGGKVSIIDDCTFQVAMFTYVPQMGPLHRPHVSILWLQAPFPGAHPDWLHGCLIHGTCSP